MFVSSLAPCSGAGRAHEIGGTVVELRACHRRFLNHTGCSRASGSVSTAVRARTMSRSALPVALDRVMRLGGPTCVWVPKAVLR